MTFPTANNPRFWWHICKTAQANATNQVLQKSHQANAPRQTRNDKTKHDRKEGRRHKTFIRVDEKSSSKKP